DRIARSDEQGQRNADDAQIAACSRDPRKAELHRGPVDPVIAHPVRPGLRRVQGHPLWKPETDIAVAVRVVVGSGVRGTDEESLKENQGVAPPRKIRIPAALPDPGSRDAEATQWAHALASFAVTEYLSA